MNDGPDDRQRWFALVRVTELKYGLGFMEVVDCFPTHAAAMQAFLQDPNKYALAVFPHSFYLKFDPGCVLPFKPGEHQGKTWVEDMDRALNQVLGRPCFEKPFTMAEQAREAGKDTPSNKVVDLNEYRRRKLGLDQEP